MLLPLTILAFAFSSFVWRACLIVQVEASKTVGPLLQRVYPISDESNGHGNHESKPTRHRARHQHCVCFLLFLSISFLLHTQLKVLLRRLLAATSCLASRTEGGWACRCSLKKITAIASIFGSPGLPAWAWCRAPPHVFYSALLAALDLTSSCTCTHRRHVVRQVRGGRPLARQRPRRAP